MTPQNSPTRRLYVSMLVSSWRNTRILSDNVFEELSALKREPGKPIVAWAGAELVSTLARLDLVDEYRLLVQPVVQAGPHQPDRGQPRGALL